jgi:predicted O-methyltransferase YrrM
MTAIALAMAGARVVTVDLADVNADAAFWSREVTAGRPRQLAKGLDIEFVVSPAMDYLPTAPAFDMAFLDGSHLEADVYAELCLVKAPLIVLHDVFPDGEDPGEHTFIPGPWKAMQRYCAERGLEPQFVREYHGEVVRMGVIEA